MLQGNANIWNFSEKVCPSFIWYRKNIFHGKYKFFIININTVITYEISVLLIVYHSERETELFLELLFFCEIWFILSVIVWHQMHLPDS